MQTIQQATNEGYVMCAFDVYYKARSIVEDVLKMDILGPVQEDEVIREIPTSYYLTGKLYPRDGFAFVRDEADPDDVDNMTGDYDAMVSLSNQMAPSSMGLTFVLNGAEPKLRIEISYALYGIVFEDVPMSKALTDGNWSQTAYKRAPYSFDYEWDAAHGRKMYYASDHAEIHVVPRPRHDDGSMVVTVSLVNARKKRTSQKANAEITLFQPEIRVSALGDAWFSSVDQRRGCITDPDVLELDLLYSDVICFAQGHGCAAVWDEGGRSPSWVGSSFTPTCQVQQMKPRTIPGMDVFGMRYLATAPRAEVIAGLRDFLAVYGNWIGDLEEEVDTFPANLRIHAKKNAEKCRRAHCRLGDAVSILESDALCWRAFRLANRAMFAQRLRSLQRLNGECDESAIAWYPFQLAFLLQEIPSFANPEGEDRSLADLLWFPTGGGKTEAYLGVAAFCIFLRRLRNPFDGGTTVIMRYTLRLLTLQQFERAAALICSCEQIRREERLGGDPISIGLWVGGELSPNKFAEAQTVLGTLQNGGGLGDGQVDPIQIKRCPWCGAVLEAKDYVVDELNANLKVVCPNHACAFHSAEGLPVVYIDEVVYSRPPTFLVSTVDKFAQVPMEGRSVSLFGIGSSNNPPELIIQDELHLISGPLGTVVGLYEAGIERLCMQNGIRPKILASTATVRNAREQLSSLYACGYAQFPPQGVSMKDSFFAVEASPEEKPARLYMGLMATDSTQTTSLIRVQAALLFATRYLESKGYPDEVVDAYWTLVGYFNTLRELGGTLTTVSDGVQSRFSFLAASKLGQAYPGVDPTARYDHALELTSRKSNAEITRAIENLETPFSRDRAGDAFDFVLATNMISVGVDVGRLGVMAVCNQPKSNSEYIQATSRVGRSKPGLVVTVYNAARSRDRSHYEQFLRFHSSLYRYVESSSLTPFADRARDRALHAVFIMLCRYLVDGLAANDAAGKFDSSSPQVEEVIRYLLDYAEKVDPSERKNVEYQLEGICRYWEERTVEANLVYKNRTARRVNQLLENDISDDCFATMESMRNVEASSNIYLFR